MRRSVLIAAIIAIAAAGWVGSGLIGKDSQASADRAAPSIAERQAQAGHDVRRIAVRVARSLAQPRTREIVVRGRTEAIRSVHIKAEVIGRIVAIDVKKGARVETGQPIARIAVDDREAGLAEARALVRQRQIEYEAAHQLNTKGYRAATQLAGSQASLDAAKAMVKRMEIDLAKTIIRAPFDGIVDARPVELGDYVEKGTPVATIVDEDPYLIVAQVAETDVGKLQVGGGGRADVITGSTVEGRIRFIAATADPATRTFRIELQVPNPDGRLRNGVTAEIRFPVESVPAHFVSPAILTLNDAGQIGVRCVDDDAIVVFHPVRILASGEDGVWLAGLPPEVSMITVGQEFVRHGDAVRVLVQPALPSDDPPPATSDTPLPPIKLRGVRS